MKSKIISLVIIMILSPIALFSQSKADVRHQKQVDELMSKLSVKQKVAQLFIITISRNPSEKTKAFQDSLVREYGVGSIIIMRGPIAQFIERVNYLQSISTIPLLEMTDAEWGANMRFAEYPAYPRQALLARIEDNPQKFLYKMGKNVAKELKDLNIYVNLAPVADVCPDPYNKADGQRSFCGDPQVVADLATAYMKGMQDNGIYACGKHYPGHGDTYVDSHYERPIINHSKEKLYNEDLFPYNKMIANGLAMVMVGHFSYPVIDPSGDPMSISKLCVQDLLKREQGFKGVVMTDAVTMQGLSKGKDPIDINTAVYKAGSDMILMPDEPMKAIEAIADSVSRGIYSMEELDAKVRKVLTVKANAGFFDKGYSPIVKNLDQKIARATRRDNRLIRKMQKAMARSSKPEITPLVQDRTLILDNQGNKK